MPSIRIPESAELLLPFCRRSEEPAENACFDTYADLITFAASCGFQRTSGRRPDHPEKFLQNLYPVDLAVFKNQGLFPNLLLIGLGCELKAEVARDEERLCRLIESFADIGFKFLTHELKTGASERFHLELANVVETVIHNNQTVAI